MPPVAIERGTDDVVPAARKLYLEQEGSEEGWQAWSNPPDKNIAPPGPRPVQFTRPLPDFSLKDASGRAWRLADLRGKTIYLNVWATW